MAKAKAGIEKDPKSSFWHDQAGVAYDALGDFDSAIKELKLASALDPSNPIDDYALYALYKRKEMHAEQRAVLLDALEKDPNNPQGHFEFGFILESEKHWPYALKEYRTAKLLITNVKGSQYVDPRGNAYGIGPVREQVDKAIDRVSKLGESTQHQE